MSGLAKGDPKARRPAPKRSVPGEFLTPAFTVIATADDSVKRSYQNYRRLVDRVDDVFGDVAKASAWLSTPNEQLGGKTPLEVAREADYDGEVLEPTLIRIEHGVYV